MAAADERSISAAARRLGASASTVSQQLSNLETAVGAPLLERSARPLRLTRAGEIMHRRAQTILAEAAQARAELAMADLAQLTSVRLGMIEDFEADVTPRLLTHMAGQLQDCQFLLETGASHSLHDQLDAQHLDIVVAAQLGDSAEWAETHPLMREGFVVAAPRGLLTGAGDTLDQLRTSPLIHYTTRHYMGRLIAAHLARHAAPIPRRFELDSYHAILALVAQGSGWTILPPLALMRARRFAGEIDVRPLPLAPLTRTIALTARQGVLGNMPAEVAATLAPILQEAVVAPALDRYPFMRDALALL
ncbi:DNA-binding transcriptional regulator, LysR family [Roseovarius nanhaiticus]|uniref:DNA-binding transcriptional regulator, LysR family n=2 Tax=Roseovarius nanhaiticus TaxID=573024 RepID=A0A1N7G0U2_9RHOB|nr:DNA-binding transcriptional regulator, LysR family [Roseovarius nanhaiticus]SIS06165.1 DNA-binding transcriptional regulator, LysR family [Roseovarius nanhaiticus]